MWRTERDADPLLLWQHQAGGGLGFGALFAEVTGIPQNAIVGCLSVVATIASGCAEAYRRGLSARRG
jgi:hypothetical protein